MRVNGSIDANVVLRLLLNDVPAQHDIAVALVSSQIVWVPTIALIEAGFVLHRAYGLTREQVAETLRDFIGLDHVNCEQEWPDALDLFATHSKLCLEDCVLALQAVGARAPLWTFDRKLANQTDAQLLK